MKRYRIAENEYNIMHPPWSGAIGIEDLTDGDPIPEGWSGEPFLAVPSLVCWFTRGSEHQAELVVDLLNAHEELKSATP